MTTSTETKVYFTDLNATQKQRLADKLLNDHPMRLQNQIVEYILSKSWEDEEAPFSWDDVTNYEYYGSVDLGGEWLDLTEEERDDKLPLYEHLAERASNILDKLENLQCDAETDEEYDLLQEKIDRWEPVNSFYGNKLDSLESMDFDEKPEIYQWFSCSNWLIGQLESYGQCTLDDEFWGRGSCGQSVTLDYIIQQIAFDYACDYGKDYLTNDQVEGLN